MLFLKLDPQSDISLTRQLFLQIRSRILSGELVAGFRLPASRELAGDCHISRNTVLTAYELLMAEGFIESKPGSGTFVTPGARLELPAAAAQPPATNPLPKSLQSSPASLVDFRSGVPALDRLPRTRWAQLLREAWLEAPDGCFGYQAPEGLSQLREVLCDYLKRTRGIVCAPEQILITSGSVQGLSLAAGVLLPKFPEIILEDPSNRDIGRIFGAPSAVIHPVPVDELGIISESLPRLSRSGLLVVTPSHQFPLGGILPVNRRIALIGFARDTSSLIVEDDYDSEFRYDGPPVSALQGLDPERVIYLGTFSKILFPALRLGYMVLPRNWVEPFRKLKKIADYHSNSLNQMALARFIREGSLDRHLVRVKKIYRKRRDLLVKSLQQQFPGRVRSFGMSTGLHLISEFAGIEFTPHLVRKLRDAGVGVHPVEDCAVVTGRHRGQLVMGYGHLSEEQIAAGIRRLAQVLMKTC